MRALKLSRVDRWIFHIRPCYSSGCLAAFNFEELNAVFHLTWEGWLKKNIYIYIYNTYIHTGKYWSTMCDSEEVEVVSSSPNRVPAPYLNEGRPLWGRAAYTAVHGALLSSVPSGDRSANPATLITPEASLQRLVPLVGTWRCGSPSQACLIGSCLAGFGFTSLVFLGDAAGLRTVASIRDFGWSSPGPMAQDLWGQAPLGKNGVHRGTRCPSLRSALRRSVCQPCHVQCSRAQRSPAHISVSSAWKRSGAEMLATPSGVSRAASS